jgi:hypothetical protein
MAKEWTIVGEEEEEEVVAAPEKKWSLVDTPNTPIKPEVSSEPYDLEQAGIDTVNAVKGLGQAGIDAIDTPYAVRQGVEAVPEVVKKALTTMLPFSRDIATVVGDMLPDELSGKAPASDLPGLKQAKEFLARDEDASEGSQAARTAAEWGAGGLRKAVSKAADVVPDLLMAGGAFLGDLFTDDEPLGEVAGGGTGLVASVLRGRKIGSTADAIKALNEVAEKEIPKNIDTKQAGTLADVTGDRGLYDVQATLEATPSGQRALDDIELARQKQIASEVREPFGNAPAQPTQDAAGAYIEDVLKDVGVRTGRQSDAAQIPYAPQQTALDVSDAAAARANAGAQSANQAAGQALQEAKLPLATNQTLAQSGEGMYDVATAQYGRENDAADILWDKVRAQGDVDLAPVKGAVDDIRANLTKTQADNFNAKYGSDFDWLKGDNISPEDIADKISDLKKDVNAAYKSDAGAKTVDKNLEKVIKALDKSFAKVNPDYEAARDASAAIYERWGKGALPEALKGPKETFGRTLPFGDEIGAFNARILKEAEIPGMPEAIAERLKSLARRSVNGVDEMFMREYESVMDTMPPEFRRKADALIAAGEKAEAATGLAKTVKKTSEATAKANTAERKVLAKALEADQSAVAKGGEALEKTVGKTNLNKYAQDPTKTVNDLVKASDGKGLAALYRQVQRLGPEAIAGFRSKVGEDLISQFSKGGDAGGIRAMDDAPLITPDSFKKFQDMKETLIQSGVLDATTADAIGDALRKTKSTWNRSKGTSRLFGNTAQGADIASSGLAVLVSKLMPGGGTTSLVMTGALKRFFKNRLSGIKQNSQAHKILNEMILNPKKYVAGVERAKNSEEAVRMITAKINAAIQTQSALTEE